MNHVNILLIGGGITSSLIGFYLRHCKNINIDLWEMDKEIGGRMKTLKCKGSRPPIDLGAQYITTNNVKFNENKEIYDSLLKNSEIKPLSCTIKNIKHFPQDTYHFVAPKGMNSLVEYFIRTVNFKNICVSHKVNSVNILEDLIEVKTENGQRDVYGIVVLTVPVPCILNLSGNFKSSLDISTYEKLKQVKYTRRYALVLLYNKYLDVDWAAYYIPTDTIFKYVAIQEEKIGCTSNLQSSVVFHTSVEFGNKFFNHDTKKVQSMLLEHVYNLFPGWKNPTDIFCYKWDYSQVLNPYQNSQGIIVLNNNPLIIAAGDSFTSSNFDGCVTSAKVAADKILSLI